VKSAFGNVITRFLWGGISLSNIEIIVLRRLVDALPPILRSPLLVQIDSCNLVQREIDGRALNFYRKADNRVTRDGIPDLPIRPGEIVLIKMAFSVPGQNETFHVTMTAVDRQFFCLNFSNDIRPFALTGDIEIKAITESWRSNLLSGAHQNALENVPSSRPIP
jgi:hypothetical protein